MVIPNVVVAIFEASTPTKPQKEIRKKHCLRQVYPCLEKVKHVHISSASGSTKYTSKSLVGSKWIYKVKHVVDGNNEK